MHLAAREAAGRPAQGLAHRTQLPVRPPINRRAPEAAVTAAALGNVPAQRRPGHRRPSATASRRCRSGGGRRKRRLPLPRCRHRAPRGTPPRPHRRPTPPPPGRARAPAPPPPSPAERPPSPPPRPTPRARPPSRTASTRSAR
jgi:hypothetical protein